MTYETHEFLQGSDAWHANRAKCYNASELAAAAGESKNTTRNALIASIATGTEREFSEYVLEHVINPGHRFEALARPLAEEFIGEELYPSSLSMAVAGLSKRLGASFDGKTMDDSENWEHKRLNAELAASLAQGIIPHKYHWQMEQGMMINGAKRCLFTASDWDDNDQLIDAKHVWYESNPELRAKIVPTWKQIEEDVANYVPVEVIPAAVATPIKDLPAVVLTVSGSLAIETNFSVWGVELRNFISRIPEKPSTDQEFADCKAALAAFKKAEAQLDAEEARVLSMVPDIDSMKREKKLLFDLSRTTRLALEKLVERRDIEVNGEIIQEGKDAFSAHMATLNTRLGRIQMPSVATDFPGAIKRKQNYESKRNGVSTELARAKIAANEIADKIQINLATLDEHKEHAFLFNDVATLVMKANDDLKNVITLRISEHAAEQQKKLDAEREQIRKEEEAKAEQKVKDDAEKARLAAEAAATPAVAVVPEQTQTAQPVEASTMQASAPACIGYKSVIPPVAVPEPQLFFKTQALVKFLDDENFREAEIDLMQHYAERIVIERQAAA